MAARLSRSDDGSIRVDGELEFETVPAAALASAGLLATMESVRIDLAGVTRADSSGVALLLDWVALARARGRKVRFSNVPAQMRSIIRLCELESVLATES